MGKSTFFALLGKEWFSDSLSIADMRDKTASEKLQGYWILEIAEMNGIKKVDVETVKSFISRTDDNSVKTYGTVVESHPRTNIIVGSSNSHSGFLRDITGNRRFWPVDVTGEGKHHPWELESVDQVWAGALSDTMREKNSILRGVWQQRPLFVSRKRWSLMIEKASWRNIWNACYLLIGVGWICISVEVTLTVASLVVRLQ